MISPFSARTLKSAALLSLSTLMASSAFAQQAQQRPAAPAAQPAAQAAPSSVVPLKADPNQTEWTKVCGRDPASQAETCYTTRDFVAENNQPVLAVAVYESKVQNKPVRQVRYLLPLTFLLTPGVRTSIDGGQAVAGKYTICVQNGCFAEFIAADAVFAKLKSGKTLAIQVQNQAAVELSFTLPLDGFAKAFDGAPMDPRVLEEQQKKLQEELQRRSDEMRKQMQGGAPDATAPAAPAPAAPAAPAAPKP
jgi:invasion protein IalB